MEEPQYIIFVDEDGTETCYAGPLEETDRDYLIDGILPLLRPLTDEEYCTSFAYLTGVAFTRSSNILLGHDLLWCIEKAPGLIVIRFSPDGKMAWGSFRSPIPNFGRRTPTEEDLRYASERDENEENNQCNLVFRAWDANFDEQHRELHFKKANEETIARFRAALVHFRVLSEQLREKYPDDTEALKSWLAECQENIKRMAGDGIRLIWQ